MTLVTVNDKMQCGYSYTLVVPAGQQFDIGFKPYFSPKEMLAHGVFEGKYLNDCTGEFPKDWYDGAKISDVADINQNFSPWPHF